MSYGAMDLATPHTGRPHHMSVGLARAAERRVRHELIAGGVKITLPPGGRLTAAEAKRLAWGLLADLAPDEVDPTPEVVTYSEAQRLAVLRALGDGKATTSTLADALGWGVRTVQRRVNELIGDGRVEPHGPRQDRTFKRVRP